MKKYLLSFVVLLLATVVMANNDNQKVAPIDTKPLQESDIKIDKENVIANENVANFRERTCTATATITINGVSTTFTNTVTCDCSNSTACSQANAGNSANVQAYIHAQLEP